MARTRPVQSLDPEHHSPTPHHGEWVGRSLENRRTPMVLFVLFGIVALLLSAIGIYGVLAFSVAQRVREFGIRQALGANRRSILSLVFKQGLMTAGVGLAVGLAGSYGLSRYLETCCTGSTRATGWGRDGDGAAVRIASSLLLPGEGRGD